MSALLKLFFVFFFIGFSGCAIIENEDPEEMVEGLLFS